MMNANQIARDTKALRREMERLSILEERWLAQPSENLLSQKMAPWRQKLNQSVPAGLSASFEAAFSAAFHALFQQGKKLLDKTQDRQALAEAYRRNRSELERGVTRRALAGFETQRRKGVLVNGTFTAAEGAVLGLLGVGLPDIPVYLGVILRTMYGIALSYGYDDTQPGERRFLLAALCAAVERGEQRQVFSHQCDDLGRALDLGASPAPPDEEEWIARASHALAGKLLLAKFVQGLPLVGAAGGVTNAVLLSQISRAASLKYKKRFLYRTLGELRKHPL